MITQWKCRTECKFPHSLLPNYETAIRSALFDTPYEDMKNLLRFYQFWKTNNNLEPLLISFNGKFCFNSGSERWIGLCLKDSNDIVEFDLFSETSLPQLQDIEIINEVARHKGKIRSWNPAKHILLDHKTIVDERGLQGKQLWELDWPHTKIIFTCGDRKAEWFPKVEFYTYTFPVMNKLKRTITLDIDNFGGAVKTMQYLFTNREQFLKDEINEA
jgi:hypothetical protein